jgi:hypothetical protein
MPSEQALREDRGFWQPGPEIRIIGDWPTTGLTREGLTGFHPFDSARYIRLREGQSCFQANLDAESLMVWIDSFIH